MTTFGSSFRQKAILQAPNTQWRKTNIAAQLKLNNNFYGVFMVEISRLFWKKVYTSDGFLLGETESAELDQETWNITNFYVGLTDQATTLLNIKRPFMGKVMVCLPVSLISAISDTAILNKSQSEIKNLKQCRE